MEADSSGYKVLLDASSCSALAENEVREGTFLNVKTTLARTRITPALHVCIV